jgi:prophage DNA circulation protein
MSDLLNETLGTASFEGVQFPTPDLSVKGGHNLVKHRAYRRRGVDIEPTGQKEFEGSITAILVNGLTGWGENMYPGRYSDLIEALQNNPIGTLWHPIKGEMRVGIESWEEKFAVDVRNGCFVEIQYTEHNASASTLFGPDNAPNTNTTQSVAVQATAADTAMASTGSTSYTPVTPTFETQLDALAESTITAAGVRGAVAQMRTVVNTNLALSDFEGVDAHDAVVALEDLLASVAGLEQQYLAPFTSNQVFTVPLDMPLWRVAQLVYGNASKASLILSANSVSNVLLVRGGTVLSIPTDR